MKLDYTDHFLKRIKKKVSKDQDLKYKLNKQLKLLALDIRHPSLRTHKLKGRRIDQYSAWVEENLRLIFLVSNKTIILVDIIDHDEY